MFFLLEIVLMLSQAKTILIRKNVKLKNCSIEIIFIELVAVRRRLFKIDARKLKKRKVFCKRRFFESFI